MKHLKQEIFTTSFLQAGASIQVLYSLFHAVSAWAFIQRIIIKSRLR